MDNRRERHPHSVARASLGSFNVLSERERQIVQFAVAGYVDKEISKLCGITTNTCRTYWSRIRLKLGEMPRAAIAAAYVESELATKEIAFNAESGYDWRLDLVDEVLETTEEFAQRLQYPSTRVSQEVALQVFHPDDVPNVQQLIERVRSGEMVHFHFRARYREGLPSTGATTFAHVVRADGVPRWVYGKHVPSLDLSVPLDSG